MENNNNLENSKKDKNNKLKELLLKRHSERESNDDDFENANTDKNSLNSNSNNTTSQNNQNLKEQHRAIFDKHTVNYDIQNPKQIFLAVKRFFKNGYFDISICYLIALSLFINYFDYPKELNLNEAKSHIGKVTNIEIPNPSFGRRPYHNSNSCFIHFEYLDGAKEKLVAKNCTYELIPKIWKAKEIKIYNSKSKIFPMYFIYQIKGSNNAILYQMTNSDLMEMCSEKLFLIKIVKCHAKIPH